MPRLTVFMPTLNAEKFIAEAITSILQQTFTDYDFRIMDGGSSDCTVEIASAFAKRDKRITIHQSSNSPAARFNSLLFDESVEFLAVAHADDVSTRHRFERQMTFMLSDPELVLSGTGTHFWLHDKKNFEVHHYSSLRFYPQTYEELRCKLPFWWCYSTPSVIINAKLARQRNIQRATYEELTVGADWMFSWECSKIGKVANLYEALIAYRHHHESDGARHKAEIETEVRLILSKIAQDAGFWSELTEEQQGAFLDIVVEEDEVYNYQEGYDYARLFQTLIAWNDRSKVFDQNLWSNTLLRYLEQIRAQSEARAVISQSLAASTQDRPAKQMSASDIILHQQKLIGEANNFIHQLTLQGDAFVAQHEKQMSEANNLIHQLTLQGEAFVAQHEKQMSELNKFIESLSARGDASMKHFHQLLDEKTASIYELNSFIQAKEKTIEELRKQIADSLCSKLKRWSSLKSFNLMPWL